MSIEAKYIDFDNAGWPQRDWNKTLEIEEPSKYVYKNEPVVYRVYSVRPQAHIISVPQPVGILAGGRPLDHIPYAMSKSYRVKPKYGVVKNYALERNHREPLELGDFVYDVICDIVCHYELNRHRPARKEWESGRYVNYLKHGITIVFPWDMEDGEQYNAVINDAFDRLKMYAKALVEWNWTRQQARRFLPLYMAIEGVYALHPLGIVTTGRYRSHTYSPNGKESEPQIGAVVDKMIEQALPYLTPLSQDFLEQIGKGHR